VTIFALDHIVFAISASERKGLIERLQQFGFRPEAFTLEFPEIGAASESLSFSSGGFVEFVVELDPTRSPRVWFDDIPRVIGLGFASDDFDADTWWRHESRAWVMNEDHLLPDGTVLNIHAAGPEKHLSAFYIFVMDRADGQLQFPDASELVRLRAITIRGSEAPAWNDRLRRWLDLPAPAANRLKLGNAELVFEPTDEPGAHATPTFSIQADAKMKAQLTHGLIEFVTEH
jgi:hypothetical protein